MIERKKKKCKCGCGREGFIWSHGMLKSCWMRLNPPKAIKSNTERRKTQIEANNSYYRWAIGQNIIKNSGKCLCDNCGDPIQNPYGQHSGKLVCHILGWGANQRAYYDKGNHFILGRGPLFGECNCGPVFDDSKNADKQAIYPERMKRLQELKFKYK